MIVFARACDEGRENASFFAERAKSGERTAPALPG